MASKLANIREQLTKSPETISDSTEEESTTESSDEEYAKPAPVKSRKKIKI